MFGEKDLIGFDEIKLYSNNKYKLPYYTFAEPKEKLYYLKNIKYICLMNEKKLMSIIDTLLPKIKEDYSNDYYRKFVRTLFGKMIASEIVNSKNQILLPKEWKEEYDFKDKLLIEGNIDHLKIFSNIEDYNTYKLKKTTK